MVCTANFSIENIADLLVWPTTCDFYFYLRIFMALLVILTWTLYKIEKGQKGSSDILSALAVSSIAVLVLAVIGSLIKNSVDIPMISTTVLLSILAFTIPIILIWIFKK